MIPPIDAPEPSAVQTQAGGGPPTVRRWRWAVHLLILTAYPLAIGLLSGGLQAGPEPALSRSTSGLLVVCAEQALLFAVVLGLAWLASRFSRDDLQWRWRGGLWVVPLGIGYSVALRAGLAVIAMLVVIALVLTRAISLEQLPEFAQSNRPDVDALVDVAALRSNPAYYWLSLTLVSFVVAGLREELWRAAMLAGMRAVWPAQFGSRAGQIAAAGAAAVVFGVGHIAQGALGAVAAGLLGLGLGLIIVLHRSIWPAVIAHGMFDATTFALLPWLFEQLKTGA